jgi:hypothetical protein
MKRSFAQNAAGMAALVLGFSACGGAGTGAPSVSLAAPAMAVRIGDDTVPNRSGQYAGKVKDSVYKLGKASESLGQSGSSVGGTLSVAYSNGKVSESVALTVNGASAKGSTIIKIVGGTYCAFSTSSTYDSKTNEVTGTYSAIHGCTGETGTFELKHQCTYVTGADEDVWRPQTGPKPC